MVSAGTDGSLVLTDASFQKQATATDAFGCWVAPDSTKMCGGVLAISPLASVGRLVTGDFNGRLTVRSSSTLNVLAFTDVCAGIPPGPSL